MAHEEWHGVACTASCLIPCALDPSTWSRSCTAMAKGTCDAALSTLSWFWGGGSPTTAHQQRPVTAAGPVQRCGIVCTSHVPVPGLITHKEVLDMYREIMNASHSVTIVTPEQQRKTLASDRSNTYLDTRKVEGWAPQILPVKDAVRKALQGMKRDREKKAAALS